MQLPGGVGELTVPAGFQYLDSAQSSYVLHKLWHNPPQANLGMLFPSGSAPLAANSWGYVIDYKRLGYVSDADADAVNYEELLHAMQQQAAAANTSRTAAGYEAVYLAGWGAQPYYDKQQHALHWARLLRSGAGFDRTLNYSVRMLGRRGILVFNAVADPSLLSEIKASVPTLLANVQFAHGEQYRDFNPTTDDAAVYSVGSLATGKAPGQAGVATLLTK